MTTSNTWGIPIKWTNAQDATVYMSARANGKTNTLRVMYLAGHFRETLPAEHEHNGLDDL